MRVTDHPGTVIIRGARIIDPASALDATGTVVVADGRIRLIDRRLTELAQWPREDHTPVYTDPDTLRIARRLHKHGDFLFTFLDKPDVPFDNNLAERAIRPAVILRKNSQSNRSEGGAATQAVLTSIHPTLRLRGFDPPKTITAALKTDLQTGQLPPLPEPVAADG